MTPGAELLSIVMRGVETAMKNEGVLPRTRERVVNRLIWGEPEGLRAVRNAMDPGDLMTQQVERDKLPKGPDQ